MTKHLSDIQVTGSLVSTQTIEGQGGVITKTVAGTPSGSASDGMVAIDVSNNKLYFRSGGSWRESGSASSVATLTDVEIVSLSSGQALVYNGTKWVNQSIAAGSGAVYTATIGDGTTSSFTITHNFGTRDVVVTVRNAASPYEVINTAWNATTASSVSLDFGMAPSSNSVRVAVYASVNGNNVALSLDDITDVTITSVGAGQFLKWNGTAWVNDTIPTINTLDDVGDVTITSASADQILKWNGTAWVNDSNLLSAKAPLASPTFTGTVSGITATMVGLGSVNNTADTAKPVSTAQQTALDLKANLASPTFTGTTTLNDATVSGNLIVSGTTTSINTETLTVDDNIIVLNNNATGAPSQDAGIEVERGSSANVQLRWNETTDKWQFTNDGSTYSDLGAGGATISDTAPATPTTGQIWFDSTVGKTFVYYDSQWIEVGGVGVGARMVSSSSAPASPLEGSMWFDTDTAQTFVYYDSSWIEIGASGVTAGISDTAPGNPVSGQLWFNSLTGGTFVYYATNWVEVGASPFSTLVNVINAKGDIFVGTADNTVGGLTAGSANQVLTVDSTTATGLKWATPTVYQAIVANVSDAEIGYLDGVTSAIQTQLNTKAPLASPTLTGTPLAPTPSTGTNTTQIATTAFVTEAIPVGVINPYAGSSAPSGWLLCYGQSTGILRSTYSALFAVIGTTYGAGDGTTTFNLPDLRGRAVAGLDNMGGTAASRLTATVLTAANALGATGGTQTHTMTSAEMPSHTHTQNAHSHTVTDPRSNIGEPDWVRFGSNGPLYDIDGNSRSLSASSETATNQNTGGGTAHLNTQPTIVLNYIIKAL